MLICRCFCPSKEPGLPDGLLVSLYGIGRDRVSRWGEWEPTGGGPIPERDRRGQGLSLCLLGWGPLGLGWESNRPEILANLTEIAIT